MKGLLPKIFKQAPAVVKKVAHTLENDHAKVFIEAEQIHPDVVLFKGVAFAKKAHFKDYGSAMNVAKAAGVKVKDMAAAVGCAVSTAYKAMKDAKGK